MTSSIATLVPRSQGSLQFADLQENPDAYLPFVFHMVQRHYQPLYGFAQALDAFQKIKGQVERLCTIILLNRIPVGCLVCKTTLQNRFAQYGVSQSLAMRHCWLTDPVIPHYDDLIEKIQSAAALLGASRICICLSEMDRHYPLFLQQFRNVHTWTEGFHHLFVLDLSPPVREIGSRPESANNLANFSWPSSKKVVDFIRDRKKTIEAKINTPQSRWYGVGRTVRVYCQTHPDYAVICRIEHREPFATFHAMFAQYGVASCQPDLAPSEIDIGVQRYLSGQHRKEQELRHGVVALHLSVIETDELMPIHGATSASQP